MQEQPHVLLVRILIKSIDSLGVERRRAPNDPVDLVLLREQQLGQIGAVLTGDAGEKSALAAFFLFQSEPNCTVSDTFSPHKETQNETSESRGPRILPSRLRVERFRAAGTHLRRIHRKRRQRPMRSLCALPLASSRVQQRRHRGRGCGARLRRLRDHDYRPIGVHPGAAWNLRGRDPGTGGDRSHGDHRE